jgi:hypothetical protein
MKTIILTENQIKRVLTTINSEKKLVNEQVAQLKPIKQFNINNSFKSGQFQLTNTSEIDAAISEINGIVAKTPNIMYDVVITSSESKVPNRGVGLKPGDLSLKRGQEAEKYIKNKLGEKVSLKNNNLGIQGPEWNPSKGKDNPEYTKYQYITISLVVSAGQKPTSSKDACNWSFKSPGGQGDPSKNYITANEEVQGKGDLTITTGSIPDRMVVVNAKNQIVKDSGYVATKAHKYKDFKYVPYYVSQLTKLNGTPAVSGKNLITIEATDYNSLMKQLLVNPEVIPNSSYLQSLGEEVSLGVNALKKMVESGTTTFVLYNIEIGASVLPFDVNTGDKKVVVFSPVGQTGYEITGSC